MKDWLPFFSIELNEFSAWWAKFIIGPMLAIAQLMILAFFLALAARLAWTI